MKTVFHDRHEERDYRKALILADQLRRDASLVANAKRHVERFMANDPHMARYTALWRDLLDLPAHEIAAALVEDTPRGALIRETRPAFYGEAQDAAE
ncbi:hypothetical protein HHL28_08430 [Aerophototrophica crusticola]|uniref:Uncharacterized protein n=1 Tax=Aerophototrophica crusticola TaxID=1709002 RepID=A0A858R770_9PROT|nr:hypothetical protein HHL28_08430 [Rhodospirillaceae bacterium B3]